MFRQWREEREKLIQCIHLQQLELSQRSLAAHERAADIAKVFFSSFLLCVVCCFIFVFVCSGIVVTCFLSPTFYSHICIHCETNTYCVHHLSQEFARAIECFEERLVSVEGNVQKEIMSIKSIAESLLHATQASPQAQSQPALTMINTSYNNSGHSGASYSNSGGNSRA